MAHNFDYLATPGVDAKDAHPFIELYPSLLGKDDARQFIVHQDDLYCIRPSCEGCPYFGNGCEAEEGILPQSAIPHPRRGVGFEERPFLILRFREGHSFETLPQDLWDNPWADVAYGHEANLHWAHTDPKRATFHTLKGQLRYYGTRDAFVASPYAAYLDVYNEYTPSHHIVSLDYSAIEPRVATVTSREPQWLEVFKGEPKVIFKEITLAEVPEKLPKYVWHLNGAHHCFLVGEMDKDDYATQCGKCKLKDVCTTKRDHLKNVPTDWHGLNAEGLYGDEFTKCKDKFLKKDLRGIAKIVGLALCYGGEAYTVSKNMQSSKEAAQARIDNFFRKLTVLAAYMSQQKKDVMNSGWVYNMFGRARDVSHKAFSQDPDWKQRRKDQGYAERTSLNHPIQSTAADVLKIGSIKATELIERQQWSPFYGLGLVQQYEQLPHYTDLKCTMASSIHDELMYLMRTDLFSTVIPPLYIEMQVDDIMRGWQAGYMFEMDCEFDPTRSWTASEKFDTALIYLLRHTQGLGTQGAAPKPLIAEAGAPKPPTFALINYEDITPALLERLREVAQADAIPDSETLYDLGVLHERQLHPHGSKFSPSMLESLDVPYWLISYHQASL